MASGAASLIWWLLLAVVVLLFFYGRKSLAQLQEYVRFNRMKKDVHRRFGAVATVDADEGDFTASVSAVAALGKSLADIDGADAADVPGGEEPDGPGPDVPSPTGSLLDRFAAATVPTAAAIVPAEAAGGGGEFWRESTSPMGWTAACSDNGTCCTVVSIGSRKGTVL